jgi:hypothetical protein
LKEIAMKARKKPRSPLPPNPFHPPSDTALSGVKPVKRVDLPFTVEAAHRKLTPRKRTTFGE